MRLASLMFTATLCASALNAQTPTFEFRPLAQPGVSIGSHVFTADTVILDAALSDAGEIAFIARFNKDDGPHTAVFTSKRIVASDDDVIDGKYIASFPPHGGVAINKAGQVAFEAVYTESRDARGLGEIGIFVENRLAVHRPRVDGPVAFSLNDDGQVLLRGQPSSATAASPQKQSVLDRIRVRPPRLPLGAQIDVAPKPPKPAQRTQERPPLVSALSPFDVMCVNGRGEVLIPVNLVPRGFILLLGTPTAGASGGR